MYNDIQIYPRRYSIRKNRRYYEGIWDRIRDWITQMASLENLLILVFAFFLGRAVIVEELSPFGTAFIIAATYYRRELIWPLVISTSLGLFTAAESFSLWQSLTVLFVLTALLQATGLAESRKVIVLPALAFLVTVVVKGTFAFLWTSTMYDLMTVIFEGLFAAGLTYAFYIVFTSIERIKTEDSCLTAEEAVCYVILAASVLGGIRISLGSLDTAGIISGFIIIIAGYVGGSGMGAIAGVVAGMAPSLTTVVTPTVASLYAFSGLASGLLRHLGKAGSTTGYIAGHLILAIYFIGDDMISVAFAEMIISAALFWLFPDRWYERLQLVIPHSDTYDSRDRPELILAKLRELGQIFHELGRTFEKTSAESNGEENHTGDNINLMLRVITSNVCTGCSMFRTCWDSDVYRVYQEILEVFSKLESSGSITEKDFCGVLARRCRRIVELRATINCLWEVCQVNSYWQKKLSESRGLVASQLHGIANIVSGLVRKAEVRRKREEEIENRLLDVLESNGIDVKDIAVYRQNGAFQCQLTKKSCRGLMECTQQVLALSEEVLGCRLSRGHSNCALDKGKSTCEVTFVPRKQFDVELGVAQDVKRGSVISGDSYDSAVLDSGKFAIILSDGMGTGTMAARESSATVTLLKQLLDSGFGQELAVKTVNAALALRSPEETFSTVDLAMIDLYSGQANFLKIAAAPTFIKKGDKVKIITSSSLPIGILDTVDFELAFCELEVGDFVVMMSDGIMEADRKSKNKEDWLVEELKKVTCENSQRVADLLLSKARELSGGKLLDDMSVVVARVIPCYYQ